MWTVQNLDALHIGKIAQSRRRARTEHAVDEHADRWLDTEVVVAVTKTANDERRCRRCLQLAYPQRRGHGLQIENVADLRVFKCFAGGDADRNWRFLKRLLTLRGGHDNDTALVFVGKLWQIAVLSKSGGWCRDGKAGSACQKCSAQGTGYAGSI